jgi:hypothetical protein
MLTRLIMPLRPAPDAGATQEEATVMIRAPFWRGNAPTAGVSSRKTRYSRLLDGNFARVRPAQNLVDEVSGTAPHVRAIGSVAETSDFDITGRRSYSASRPGSPGPGLG